MATPSSQQPDSLAAFLKLFEFEKRQDLEKYCRDLVVTKRDLAQFIWACEAGVVPVRHLIHYQDRAPAQLKPTEADMAALLSNGIGPLSDDALKAARKIRQTFKDRRYLVGHMFLMQNPAHWHFLYLDQRDIAEAGNHWKPHIHFLNWLWQRDPQALWWRFALAKRRREPGTSVSVTTGLRTRTSSPGATTTVEESLGAVCQGCAVLPAQSVRALSVLTPSGRGAASGRGRTRPMNYGPVAVFAILIGVVVAVFIGAVIVMVCRDLFDMSRDRRRRRQRRRDRSSVRGEDSTWDRYRRGPLGRARSDRRAGRARPPPPRR
jgi:hypothetical protein